MILDVLAEDMLGRKFNMKVQIALPAGMVEQMALYTAEKWIRGPRESQNYDEPRPSISLWWWRELWLKTPKAACGLPAP